MLGLIWPGTAYHLFPFCNIWHNFSLLSAKNFIIFPLVFSIYGTNNVLNKLYMSVHLNCPNNTLIFEWDEEVVFMYKQRTIDSLDALKIAIQTKIDMKAYYDEAANLISNEDATTILRGLAEKEDQHRQKLIRKYRDISGKKILYLNLGKKHKLNTLKKCEDDPNDAIRAAKTNEAEIRKFYLAFSRSLFDKNLREIFRQLAMEEEQHLALLESSFEEPLNLNEDQEERHTLREMASSDRTEM